MKLVLKITNIVLTSALILIIAFAAVIGFSAWLSEDKIPTINGYKLLTVLSGSMEPAIQTGDVIIERPLAAGEKVKEGDIITFFTKEKTDMLITHRVVGTINVNGKPAAYVTKGDANQSKDLSTVAPDQIVGIYKGRIPYFGYVSNFLHKPVGIIVGVILPGLILIGFEFRKIWQTLSAAEDKKAAKDAGLKQGGGEQAKV
ncbi:MAG: signal peptidase I [Clostridia bacterium]|nr:signal peptidase I [Clostridia bacterium]